MYCLQHFITQYLSMENAYDCSGCIIDCNRQLYPVTISSSPLSQLYLNHTSDVISHSGRNISKSEFNQSLVFLEIFSSRKSYVDIRMMPEYSALDLFCNIGGSLGLILGAAILSVFEIFQLILSIFIHFVVLPGIKWLEARNQMA